MIWTSLSALAIIDLTIVALAASMLAVAAARGMFKKGSTPRLGRFLLAAGIVVTASYYFADFLAIAVLSAVVVDGSHLAAIDFLQSEVRGVAMLVSVALIAVGFAVVATQRRAIEEKMRSAQVRVRRAEATVIESENRFRALIEQFTDAVYCFEFSPPLDINAPVEEQIERSYDAILVDCNKKFAHRLGLKRPARALGMRLGEFDAARDKSSHAAFFRAFVESGYRLIDYEQTYRAADGELRALNVHFRGVLEGERLVAVWGSEKSVLDLKQTELALQSRQRFQDVFARISSNLLISPYASIGNAITASLGDMCRHVDATSGVLSWFDQQTGNIELLYYWDEDDVPPDPYVHQARFPWVTKQLCSGEPVSFSGMSELPAAASADADTLRGVNVKSAAIVPLIAEGRALGSCSITNRGDERIWTEQQLKDLQVLAELFASTLLRLKSQQRLDTALSELERSKERLEEENVYLQEEISSNHGFHEIVGKSDGLKYCLRQIAQVADTRTPVLIQGETGTGKELVARAVHERSGRSKRPLVKVNCAALPANLIESELFGHEPGAFTGAQARRRGRFDLADGGTLFLDEIGDFPLALQGKLLRVLQEGEFQRLGGTETITVDVRIIAATNRRLQDAVERGEFRADLYYRINTFTIEVPPLRDRDNDIMLLAQHFISLHAPRLGKSVSSISSSMQKQLEAYAWPGNVRELESVVQRALITSVGSALQLDEPLGGSAQVRQAPSTTSRPMDLQSAEKAHIEAVLRQTDWRIAGELGAAERLGLPASTLRSRMKKLGISKREAV